MAAGSGCPGRRRASLGLRERPPQIKPGLHAGPLWRGQPLLRRPPESRVGAAGLGCFSGAGGTAGPTGGPVHAGLRVLPWLLPAEAGADPPAVGQAPDRPRSLKVRGRIAGLLAGVVLVLLPV